ncbi:MAG: protein-export chaperone SecB [Rhodospirillales bacterium]|nr:protein-export chaperone SecB [Rhodospirillales bacterium]
MSETAQPQAAPLVINLQYVKDLSFEVPGAPVVYTTLRQPPRVEINLDVQARRVTEGQNSFEVGIAIRAEAFDPAPAPGTEAARIFLADLVYAGVFTLNGIPEASVEPVLLVECPRLLFPFARDVLATATRDGGFPPVLLQPIDFLSLWQARRAQGAGGLENGIARA